MTQSPLPPSPQPDFLSLLARIAILGGTGLLILLLMLVTHVLDFVLGPLVNVGVSLIHAVVML